MVGSIGTRISPGLAVVHDNLRSSRSHHHPRPDVPSSIHMHQFENGLVLLVEQMDWVESAAFSLFLPAGCSRDPADRLGLASFTCEMAQRGCGARNSRQYINDLENLGVDHTASVSLAHTSFGGAMPAEKLDDALPICADLVQRAHLPEEQLEDARSVCVQEIRALDDELSQQVMLALRRCRYGDPWGRNSQGTLASVDAVQIEDVRQFYHSTYRPRDAILSVAGNVDFAHLRDHVGVLFSQWPQAEANVPPPSTANGMSCHIEHPSQQMHLGVAYGSVPYADPRYYDARAAVGVLSDGMSSRLFTEIREKRGLCYAVYAVCHTLRDRGSVFCYAGTTTERAQETLDVLIEQLCDLQHGIRSDELMRLQARLKSALVMQQESSAARSGSMAADWYYLRRVQTLDEVCRIVDNLTCDSINAYLAEHPPSDFTIVTLGQKDLERPVGIL